ncbi:MAG: ABC transporter ATP-binding protein [Candidatus Hodarchaeales archaeon]|jgi:putative ABC transport system ATP-binding protein
MIIIQATNLVKNFSIKDGIIPVLKDISFKVNKGEFIGIIGPSGSGKTTLMAILGGLLDQTDGSVKINGFNLEKLSKTDLADYRLQNLGFIFQSNHLIPTLTAIENIEVPMILAKIPIKKRKEKALDLLKQVDLEKKQNHFPDELSGGEAQRIGIARALANNPDIILADEPTGTLDSMTGKEIILLLQKLAKIDGKTILTVSHDPSHLPEFDRVLKIENGSIFNEEINKM